MPAKLDIHQLTLLGVETAAFNLYSSPTQPDRAFGDGDVLHIDQGVAPFFGPLGTTEVVIELHLALRVQDHQQQPAGIGADIRLRFRFEVRNLDELREPVDQPPGSIPSLQLMLMLTSVAYSTARGIVLTRLAGTCLHGSMLPIVDVRELLTSPPPASPKTRAKRPKPQA